MMYWTKRIRIGFYYVDADNLIDVVVPFRLKRNSWTAIVARTRRKQRGPATSIYRAPDGEVDTNDAIQENSHTDRVLPR